ncbi:MAG: NYN domain-containing protein [Victivallales bacterium]|nr:NYN domain-containing protein [Victivallales bacterium]
MNVSKLDGLSEAVSSNLLAVLIDADNVSAASAKEIFERIRHLGEPIVRRAYGMVNCFSSADGWSKVLREYGIVARPQVSNISHKNVTDIALVIDAMTLLYKSQCTGICIVSSDSDFTTLAARIREEGKTVYGLGNANTPASFRAACTEFITLHEVAQTALGNNVREACQLCPRCGEKLVASRTKSNQNCRVCPSCGGMTVKLASLNQVFEQEGLKDLLAQAKKQEQLGCICPDCGASMTLLNVSSGKHRVELDVCSNCKAIWYDKNEFELLVPNDGLLLPTISAGKAYRRDMVLILAADLRSGKLKLTNAEKLKTALKNVYHVPNPDISPIISTLQCQKTIRVDNKTGKIDVLGK